MIRWTRVVAFLTGGLLFVGVVTALILAVHAYIFWEADKTAREGQRAFIGVRTIGVTTFGAADQQPIRYQLGLVWENSGNTSPRFVEIYNSIGLIGPPVAKWPERPKPGVQFSLPPRSSLESTLTTTVDGITANTLRDSGGSHMVGSAKYVDAFGAKHVTLACFTITLLPVLDYTKEGASNGIRGVQCPKYNCTDENCRRYGDQPAIAEVLKFLD